jgi:hypothetical protein
MEFDYTYTSGDIGATPEVARFNTLEEFIAWVIAGGEKVIVIPHGESRVKLEIYDDWRE